jgi:adenine/guanine phosphoribosyltransferase-like PRPP-binding protein
MIQPTDEQLAHASERLQEAMLISDKVIEFLADTGVDIRVAVTAMGISYAAGASAIEMPLPVAIDLVRGAYKTGRDQCDVH